MDIYDISPIELAEAMEGLPDPNNYEHDRYRKVVPVYGCLQVKRPSNYPLLTKNHITIEFVKRPSVWVSNTWVWVIEMTSK